MNIVNVPAHAGIFFHSGTGESLEQGEQCLQRHIFNSAPKNIGRELAQTGIISGFEEWRFWGFPSRQYALHEVPLRMFHSSHVDDLSELENWVKTKGQPTVIWAEGIQLPTMLRHLFKLCPDSLKIIYAKYCEPWLIEGLEHYDVCLVDEPWQIEEMGRRWPGVPCRLWDKLVDYERDFYPLDLPKRYDVCYVARLHPRKYHKLLFEALAELRHRRLRVVLVGSDENECWQYLEPLARQAGAETTFTGHVSTEQVNRFINASRLGVLCDQFDAVPRAMLEYMAANVPVLATSEMRTGLRYIGSRAGLARRPEQFHEGITEILDNTDRFQPRQHLLENFSRPQAARKLWAIIQDALDDRQRTHRKE